MTKEESLILNKKQVEQKITRIAFEIYENNYKEKKLFVAGVDETGYQLSKLLIRELKKISPFELKLIRIELDKDDPAKGEIGIDCDINLLKRSCLLLVDDVLHTGKTFVHSLKPFLDIDIKRIETVVLVKRSHKQFPISADYKGYELATTLNEHIEVNLEKDKFGVYLY